MIAYIEGILMKKLNDRVILLNNQIGYEILLPAIVMESIHEINLGEKLNFHTYLHQTERQPRPVLIGFNNELQRDFFLDLISVDAIGPLKAVQAFSINVDDFSIAIESKDVKKLSKLKSIGNRTAQKIIASLHGKMDKYAINEKKLIKESKNSNNEVDQNIIKQVLDVLVNQLGYRLTEAEQLIQKAVNRNNKIKTPEEIIEEVFRGGKI